MVPYCACSGAKQIDNFLGTNLLALVGFGLFCQAVVHVLTYLMRI